MYVSNCGRTSISCVCVSPNRACKRSKKVRYEHRTMIQSLPHCRILTFESIQQIIFHSFSFVSLFLTSTANGIVRRISGVRAVPSSRKSDSVSNIIPKGVRYSWVCYPGDSRGAACGYSELDAVDLPNFSSFHSNKTSNSIPILCLTWSCSGP